METFAGGSPDIATLVASPVACPQLEGPLDDVFPAPSQLSAWSGSSQMSHATVSGHDTCPSTQTSETWRSGGTIRSSAGTMPSSAGRAAVHAARNLPPVDLFHLVGLDDDEEEEAHGIYDERLSTQPRAGSHHPVPSQHAVVDSHHDHHSDNVDLLAGLRDNEGRFDPKAADDGTWSDAGTLPEDEREPTQRMPNWLLKNMQRAALNDQAGGTGAEKGRLDWMSIGVRTAGHWRLDAGHIDAQTGIEVKGEIKRSLDALERDIKSPSPHMIFQGKEYHVLVEEGTAPNGVTVTTFVAEVSKLQLEQVRKQLGPRQRILRAMAGVYYCENCWVGDGCGCFFAVSFSRRTCSHSVLPFGKVQMSWFTAARRNEFQTLKASASPPRSRTTASLPSRSS